MENLGDYIYLLVFAGIIIFNVVKSLKKAKTTSHQMPDILGNPVPETFEDKPYYETKPEPARIELNPIVQPQVAHRQTPKPKTVASRVVNVPEQEEFQMINIDFSDMEELRNGIIFSEIFNRKY